ncbi:MAG TPA: beta/gamma crystallin-related protein [Thermoanaerobaculia bacterium]|nr:beta/gamma crystallin-related protein [Thermoanaerobaculia bacterium]
MPTRIRLFAFLATVLLSAGARGAAITVWEHNDLRGATVVFDRAVPRLGDVGWNDRISSLRVDSGRWEVCRDDGYSDCRTVSADMGEVRRLESGWNDALSSLRPVNEAMAGSAEQLAGRLYRAILGRDADPEGLRNAAAQIERGQTDTLVRGMMRSAEYSNLRSQSSAGEILDRMYRGLYGRSADSAARRSYVASIERGEDAQVMLALLSADQYSGGTGERIPSPEPPSSVYDLQANGAGLVVWGANGRYESLSGASVVLSRDGRARVGLDGTTPQSFDGTWTAESSERMRLQIPDIGGRRVGGSGSVLLDGGRLARVEVTAGTPGARNQIVFSFVADDYTPPREETLCMQEARARLEGDRGIPLVLLFLAPERTSGASGWVELSGDAVVLAGPTSVSYRCEIDARRGQVLGVSTQRR